MPSITISEADFTAVALAAHAAKNGGDMEQAHALDKIARKINAALSSQTTKPYRWMSAGMRTPLRWQDMPSCIGEPV